MGRDWLLDNKTLHSQQLFEAELVSATQLNAVI